GPPQVDGGARAREAVLLLRASTARAIYAHRAGPGAGRGGGRARRLGLAPRLQARTPRPYGLRPRSAPGLSLPDVRHEGAGGRGGAPAHRGKGGGGRGAGLYLLSRS